MNSSPNSAGKYHALTAMKNSFGSTDSITKMACNSNTTNQSTENLLHNGDAFVGDQVVGGTDATTTSETYSLTTPDQSQPINEITLQGLVFIEDAIRYRSIHHKVSFSALKLYRWYHSAAVQYSMNVATFILLILAFFETPSSLSWSADPRHQYSRFELPIGFTEGIEIVCLFVLSVSNIVQGYLLTNRNQQKSFIRQNPWLTGGCIVLLLSFVDVVISLVLGNNIYRIRVRRLFRPYFLAQNTTMLKKTLKAMWNTLPEIMSVLILLSLHLYFFTMLGMLLFPQSNHHNPTHGAEFNNTEWQEYFKTFDTAFISLIVLLTTANNPDIMMPSYSENRLYALYFIVFSLIGTFLVFNLLTAIIYNQFRGYFQSSMQTSYFRRCVALSASFQCLSKSNELPEVEEGESSTHRVSIDTVRSVAVKANMSPDQRRLIITALTNHFKQSQMYLNHCQFCGLFENIDSMVTYNWHTHLTVPRWNSSCMSAVQWVVLHRYFNMVGNIVVLLNAILMTVEIAIHYEEAFHEVFSRLNIMNYVFVAFYFIEQILKILSMGKKYFFNLNCLYDGIITIALITIETIQLTEYGNSSEPKTGPGLSLWDCARIVNILVLLRLLRIIPNFKRLALVTSVMLEIIRSLKSFAGIIIIIYYVFAIMGMMAFEQAIDPPPGLPINDVIGNTTAPTLLPPSNYECGTYEQLQYWANNFNDFAASLVVLWDVMVVNNWGVFLNAFTKEVSPWSQIFFIAWWLISSVVCINLFIALILDHFIAKWEGNAQGNELVQRRTIQSLFRKHLHEPSQQRILEELNKHPSFLCELPPSTSA